MKPSTTSSIFPDVNVWLALHHEVHAHHANAVRWFDDQGDRALFVFCRQTQMGLFRLLTTDAVVGRSVLTQKQCWEIYDRWISAGKAVLESEPREVEAMMRARSSADSPSPKMWTDAYLAAFAEAAGHTLVTFDRALAASVSNSVFLK